MVQFNYKKLFLTKYMMIKKSKTNLQPYINSNKKFNLVFLKKFSESNNSLLSSVLVSGKNTIFRTKQLRNMFWDLFFTTKHNNGHYHYRRIKHKRLLSFKNLRFLNSYSKNFFFKKQQFFTTHILKINNLYKYIPRSFCLFLWNNYSDYSRNKNLTDNNSFEFLKAMLLLKKKTPAKTAITSYFTFYKTFSLIYKYSKFTRSSWDEAFSNDFFFYTYLNILFLNSFK